MQTLFFGTNNPHKLKEIQEILGQSYRVLSFKDLPEPFDVEETEPTIEGNAVLKANAFYGKTGMPCFSDDSGLEVDALDGRPGVITARYAGPGRSADDNMDKLLMELDGHANRSAQFRTVIAYFDGQAMHTFEGIIRGTILTARRGTDGFGYDPIFMPDGYAESFAEMPSAVKHKISHRGQALEKFIQYIRK